MIAARQCQKFLVCLLVDFGANANYKRPCWWRFGDILSHSTPLQAAATMGHEDVIRFLVQREAKVNEGRCELCKFRTPLQTAIKEGYESIVRFLIENGANINAREWCRDTVLHIAMSGGNESIIRLLIENGADVNVVNLRHDTVLHIVTTEGNESLIRLLIENGADVNAYSMLRIATVKGIRSIVNSSSRRELILLWENMAICLILPHATVMNLSSNFSPRHLNPAASLSFRRFRTWQIKSPLQSWIRRTGPILIMEMLLRRGPEK